MPGRARELNLEPSRCLFEWDWTIFYHGQEALRFVGLSRALTSDPYIKFKPKPLKLRFVGLSRAQAMKGRNKINVDKAECFKAQDKEMILGEIRKKHESTEVFNQKLREKMFDVYRGV